ncbi:mucin-6-like [Diadema setosum]|uniref:mucin-6-like n=1 Tax=Diadema setosum TaxID=31175 RepID=UPI003B3A181B
MKLPIAPAVILSLCCALSHIGRTTGSGHAQALDCPGNLVYLQAGPGCGSPSCAMPEDIGCDRAASAGCFCPDGMVVCGAPDHAICVELSDCGTVECPVCKNGFTWSAEEGVCILQ